MNKELALIKLQNICKKLQQGDIQNNYSKTMYLRSFEHIKAANIIGYIPAKFYDQTTGVLSLPEILDDAFNCHLITPDGITKILNALKH